MFKNANISYEIKNSKRRRYYAKFQDLALKRRREIFYEMDPSNFERLFCFGRDTDLLLSRSFVK